MSRQCPQLVNSAPLFPEQEENKMSAFVVVEIEISDEHRKDFENVFLVQAHRELEEAGAKIVGGGFDNAAALTGMPPKNRFVVIEFPTKAALEKWWNSPAGAWARENIKKYANAGNRMIAAYEATE
jgi:uncharacterized protein (DUF1330 family)